MNKVNITVPTFNRLELTRKCLSSLLALTRGDFVVNIVDNASEDGTWEYLQTLQKSDSRVNISRFSRNMGVAAAANEGWAMCPDAHYVKLDNDMEIVSADWLQILLDYARAPELGMIGYKFLAKHIVAPDTLSTGKKFWRFDTCGGACVLIPKNAAAELGFWNEDYGKYGYEDLDYSIRCNLAGRKTGYVPFEGQVLHWGYAMANPVYEENKMANVESELSGKKIFYLNKLLFENHIRPLKVERRFLPVPGAFPVRLRSNPAYAGIIRLQNKMIASIPYEIAGNNVKLDLNQWKTKGIEQP